MALRFCRVCRMFHDLDEPWPYECRAHFPPPPHRTVNVISDNLDYIRNHADGKVYSSKADYYRAVKRAGCEIVGNDSMKHHSTPKLMDDPLNDIKIAVERHSARASRGKRGRKVHGR